MQKKFTRPRPEDAEKKSTSPYKKSAGKRDNKGLKEAAKKYFAHHTPSAKPARPFRKKEDRPSRDFVKKQFPAPEKQSKEVFSSEAKVSDETRLNKYLSHAGVASRRNADELIRAGRVKVNGAVVAEMGFKVKPKDEVEFDGKLLTLEKKYYILLNKPKDFITTLNDEKGRRTVMELLRGAYAQIKTQTPPRLYPVGRLDRNTTGVLLITNDGELAQKLTHPSGEVRKIYHVLLNKKLTTEDFEKIAEGGVVLEDGIAEVDEIAYPNPKNRAEIGIQIHTGKNRFIRRLFEGLGYEVEKLDRVFFAGLTKKDVSRGKWRFLSEDEVRLLKHFSVK